MTDAEVISRLEELRDWGAQDDLCEDLEVYEAAIRFYEERDEARRVAQSLFRVSRLSEHADGLSWEERYPWLKENP